jgi:hypothetical protein
MSHRRLHSSDRLLRVLPRSLRSNLETWFNTLCPLVASFWAVLLVSTLFTIFSYPFQPENQSFLSSSPDGFPQTKSFYSSSSTRQTPTTTVTTPTNDGLLADVLLPVFEGLLAIYRNTVCTLAGVRVFGIFLRTRLGSKIPYKCVKKWLGWPLLL